MQKQINSILQRLDIVERKIGIQDAAAAPVSVDAPPVLRAFQLYTDECIPPFLAHCQALGGEAEAAGTLIQKAWQALGELILVATMCNQPDDQTLMGCAYLAPIKDAMKQANDMISRGDFENHQKAVKEAVESLQWILIKPCPTDFVESHIGGSDFWANKVRVQHKGVEAQQGFCNGLKSILQGLMKYVKEYHTTGLVWNPQGVDIGEYSPGQALPSVPQPSAPAPAAPAAASAGAGDLPRVVAAFDAHCHECLDPYVAACTALGPEAQSCADVITSAWNAQREVIAMATACKKPDQTTLMGKMGPLQEAMKEADASIQRGDFENHQKAVKEVVASLSWLMVEPAPSEFVKEHIGGSDFWANKIRVAHKGDAAQAAFCDTLKALIVGLTSYVKEHHLTGLSWNPKGNPVGDYSCSSAPAAPAPSSQSSAPAPPADSGRPGLFAELSKGSAVTGGLKKVTRDMQTWRTEYKGPKDSAAPKSSSATRPSAATAKPKPAARPPKVEYMNAGHKWMVEHQTEAQGVVEVAVQNINQSVYIYNCNNAIINITGKAKGVTVDTCKKTKVLLDSTVSSLEFVNCQRMQSQVRDTVPSVAIDKTDGILVYLSENSLAATFTTSKSSEMNISIPQPGSDDQVEIPIPEQFVHRIIQGNPPSVTSEVSDLYSG